MESNYTDLLHLQAVLKTALETAIPDSLWVKAEIASLSVHRTGHCYIDLVQSREGAVVAQARAIIWASTCKQIVPYFRSVTGSDLQAGQQVLLQVRAQYSAIYGLSLIVNDIDPDYTLGDAERKRRETLEKLEKEGLMDLQRELDLPELPYRIAVVSAEVAAGYRDFMRHLHENSFGFRFETELYPAPMQGTECAPGIAAALQAIEQSGVNYDATVVLRGGGGKLDLACYDEYLMCWAIANHPFPVITAIGHDQDIHLCDMVAYDAVKTPTALADFFVGMYEVELNRLKNLRMQLSNVREARIKAMEHRLDLLKARLEAASPRRLLEKGYILVVGPDGKVTKTAGALSGGDTISLMFGDGRVICRVETVELDKNDNNR